MKQKITKLSNLKLLESFIQINFLKGFKYIDKAGEVINRYQNEDGEVTYNLSPERLLVLNPTKTIQELRISNVDIWCHFIKPSNLGELIRLFDDEVSELLKITEPENIKRVGWRNYYVIDLNEFKDNLNSLAKIKKGKIQQIQMILDLPNSVESTLFIGLLKKKNNKKFALFLDIDAYITSSGKAENIFEKLKKIKTSLESDEFKDFVNEILSLL